MVWRCYVVDTRTGQLRAPIDIPAFSWSVSVSDSSLTTTKDKGVGEDEASGLTIPWSAVPGTTASARSNLLCPDKRSVALLWDTGLDGPESLGTPILMGMISNRTDTAVDTSFSLSSPLQILGDRYLVDDSRFGQGANGGTESNISLGPLSARGLACEVGWRCTMGKEGGELPIDWQYRGESGSRTATYDGFDIQNISAKTIIEGLANMDGGPDMQFRPILSDGYVRWTFMAGSDADVYLNQNVVRRLSWHPLGGTLEDLTVDRVGPVQRVYGTGNGTDKSQTCWLAEDMALTRQADPWPLREMTYSDTDLDGPSLQGYTEGVLAANRRPLMQFKGVIHANDTDVNGLPLNPFGSFWPGETFEIAVDGYPSLPDGVYECRLMRMDGDETDQATLTFDVMDDPTG